VGKQRGDDVGATKSCLGRELVKDRDEFLGHANRECPCPLRFMGHRWDDFCEVEHRLTVKNEVRATGGFGEQVSDCSAYRQTTSLRIGSESIDDGLGRVETNLRSFAEVWLSHGGH